LNASPQQTSHQFYETWDRFSLGVIIYQLLFLVHPFACTAKDNSLTATYQKIKQGLYVHGTKRHEIDVYKPWHDNLLNCPKEIQQFFFNTFDPSKGLGNPRLRISAEKWGKTIYKLLMASKSTASQGRSSTGATRNGNGNGGTTSRTQRTSATSGTQRASTTSGTQRTSATRQVQLGREHKLLNRHHRRKHPLNHTCNHNLRNTNNHNKRHITRINLRNLPQPRTAWVLSRARIKFAGVFWNLRH
jgi:hypothetical protein